MLSPDIGLYRKFSTDENGRPFGCPGMDEPKWVANKMQHSGITGCDLNDAPAADGMNMAEVIELYARDNGVWVNDFMDVFQVLSYSRGFTHRDLVSYRLSSEANNPAQFGFWHFWPSLIVGLH